jgi:hypothetical protein
MIELQIVIAATGLCAGGVAGALGVILLRGKRAIPRSADSKNTGFVFSGNLKQTNLLEAMQFLEIGRREGILHIYCGRRKGYLIFCGGQVIDAFYRNHTGREAVLTMLSLEEGDFYYEPKTIHQPRLIADSVMDIAFEWDSRRSGGGR